MLKRLLSHYFKQYQGIPLPAWGYLMASLINSGTSVAVIFLALYLKKQMLLPDVMIGWIMTGFGIGTMIGSVSSGILCDRLSARLVCVVSLLINGVTLVILPFLHGTHWIALIIFIMGISNFAFSPANRIVLSNACDDADQMHISSLRYMIVNLGIGLYIFIGGRIATIGYDILFISNGLLILVASAISLYAYLKVPEKNPLHEKAVETSTTPLKHTAFFLCVYSSLLLVHLIFSQLRITYPLYLHQHYNLDETLFSNIFLINTMMVLVLQVPLSNLMQRFNSLFTSGFGALMTGLGMGLIFLGSQYSFVIFLCVIWTLGEILYYSTMQALIYEKAHATQKGWHMGIFQLMAALANIVGPVTGSWLYQFENGIWVWWGCIVMGFMTLYLHIKIYRDVKRKAVNK